MGESKHTPGPWKACGAQRGGCTCGIVWSIPHDCVVAIAHSAKRDDLGEGITDEETIKANMALIASAPTLHASLAEAREALRELVDGFVEYRETHSFWDRYGAHEHPEKRMDAAMDRARNLLDANAREASP